MTLLHTTTGYGEHKYYVDGRRCTQGRFRDLKVRSLLDTFFTTRKNGQWYFYCEAR